MKHLTHEKVKDGHVHDVQEARAAIIGRSLLHLLAVIWVNLPSVGRQHLMVFTGSPLLSLFPVWNFSVRNAFTNQIPLPSSFINDPTVTAASNSEQIAWGLRQCAFLFLHVCMSPFYSTECWLGSK